MTEFSLYAVRIFCFNWETCLAFYRDQVGFPVSYEDSALGWAQMQLGSSYLGLEKCDPEDEESKSLVGRFVGTSVEVQDIAATYQELISRGVPFTSPPTKQPWGGTLAHFTDPDGNTLTLLGSNSDS